MQLGGARCWMPRAGCGGDRLCGRALGLDASVRVSARIESTTRGTRSSATLSLHLLGRERGELPRACDTTWRGSMRVAATESSTERLRREPSAPPLQPGRGRPERGRKPRRRTFEGLTRHRGSDRSAGGALSMTGGMVEGEPAASERDGESRREERGEGPGQGSARGETLRLAAALASLRDLTGSSSLRERTHEPREARQAPGGRDGSVTPAI